MFLYFSPQKMKKNLGTIFLTLDSPNLYIFKASPPLFYLSIHKFICASFCIIPPFLSFFCTISPNTFDGYQCLQQTYYESENSLFTPSSFNLFFGILILKQRHYFRALFITLTNS